MKRNRLLSAAVLVITTAAGCGTAHNVARTFQELQIVQQDVVKATGHPTVQVNLANSRYLSVGLVNSPVRDRPEQERRAKALEIAKVAFRAYSSRDELVEVHVAYVTKRTYFLIVHHTDATDVFTFLPSELRQTVGHDDVPSAAQ